jgi:hypothetical protein
MNRTPRLLRLFQTWSAAFCGFAIVLGCVRLLFPGVYVDFWKVELPTLLACLFACLSIALAASSLELRRAWLLIIIAVDIGCLFWSLRPFVGMNY